MGTYKNEPVGSLLDGTKISSKKWVRTLKQYLVSKELDKGRVREREKYTSDSVWCCAADSTCHYFMLEWSEDYETELDYETDRQLINPMRWKGEFTIDIRQAGAMTDQSF